jgi:glutamate--cysteine ligase catalytic subunit
MGLLIDGHPLPPEEMKKVLKYLREHGVLQFLNNWKRMKLIENDELKFGDEIECGVFEIDKINKTVKVSYRAADVNHNAHFLYYAQVYFSFLLHRLIDI